MNIFLSFPNIEQVVPASQFFFQILKFRKGPFKPSLGLCFNALLVDSDLHEKLKVAHHARDMGALDSLCMYFERNAWRMDPDLEDVFEAIRLMESDNKIMPFVKGEWKLPIWAPTREDTDPDIMDHVRKLGIPLGNREEIPLVILHKLGSFQHDPILKKRLDTIFSPNHHTFLINTSGTGKTKLLFEGLCLHWGLYFTCAIDSSFLGAGDFVLAINDIESHRNWTGHLPFPSSPHYATSLQHNIKTIFRLTSEALLARLLVFKMYLTACSKSALCHDHRQRWLESQIFPRTITSRFEAYGKTKYEISRAEVHDSVIDDAITHTLEDIQSIWDISPGEFFYIVIDEANVASRKHDGAFADEYGRYSILKEIIRSFQCRMGHLPVRFVVAGTIIPREHFQSSSGEWDSFRWCSDTGCFDDPEAHRRYISQFLPPHFEKSDTGQLLIKRMWHWLRGRYRYTASFLTLLLDNNFESPHTLLGGFVQTMSGYMPPENSEYTSQETFSTNNWYLSLGSKGLSRRFTSTIAMHRSVISFLTTSKGCCDFTSNDIDLVNEDYGIFLDPTCSRIGLDEPVTVIYGAKWLKQQPYFTLVRLAGTFAWNYQTGIHPSHFASSLALSLAFCFGDFCKVSNTCTVFGLTTPLLNGRLVKFVKVAERLETLDVQLSETMPDRLVFVAGAPEEVMSWFKHEHDEPFCLLPSSSSTSVTLVFCLKLSDERTFWVFVYVPSTFTRENPDFAQDIKEIHPNVIFRDQPEVVTLLDQLPNLNTDVGPSGILRISGSFRVKSATVDSIPHEEYPAGVLNIGRLDRLTKEISQDMLMRRLSRIFTGRTEPFHTALPIVAVSAIFKKRGRSTSTDDAASTSRSDGTKVQKFSEDIVVTNSGSMTRKGRKGTKSLRTGRSNRHIGDVVTGHASVVVPRSSLVDSTVPSSPYNLRKRR
ncbi:hypothetical protein F5876DRAFT_76331 [Lentinula aff. lateritia]|uniref:Uncharacterized protein n=1 Tax=Lentinula aff. lateritia TaxID=2804960 RepID=A0ACC1U277_9AGAR|nr:hypothetical protein F5876DRAFT_76331 [Lentinula aff. lateritia]